MPYAPGVQDISGQLRAQGIAQAGQAWSQAIGNIGKDLGDAFQTYKQNQFITNQAMGQIAGYTRANPEVLKYLEGASSDDPNAPTLSPEILKSWASVKTGEGVKMKDAAMVKSFLEAYDKNKMDQAQRLHIENQNKLLGQQFEQNQRMADFMKQYMTPQPPSGAPAGGGIPSAGAGAGAGTGAAPTGEPTARDVTAKLIQSTGKMPTNAQVTAQLRQDLLEYRRGQIESKEYASPELAASAAKDAVAQGAYPEGTIPIVKKNAQTGSYYLETTTSSVEPSDVAARRKALEEEAVGRVKAAGNLVSQDIESGKSARSIGVPVARLSSLINEEGLKTGKGEDFVVAARGIGKALGLPVDEAQLAKGNEGITYFGNLVRPIWAEQKGAISNNESKFYQSMGPQFSKDERANAALLMVVSERIKTDQALESNAMDFTSGDIDSKTFTKNRQRILKDFDEKIPEISRKAGGIIERGMSGQAMPVPAATPAAVNAAPTNRVRVYNPKTGKLE